MQLKAKIFISGKIITKTGLHIGGSKSSLDIGGVDLNVVKSPQGVPFIPGSSLKGKLRSLLAKLHGSVAVKKGDEGKLTDEDFPYMMHLFGRSGDDRSDGAVAMVTRLLVRDAPLDVRHFEKHFDEQGAELELGYTDVKWENTIDRKKGTAEHPRQLERVPAEAQFNFELVYDLYDDAEDSIGLSDKEKNWNIATPKEWEEQTTLLDMHIWAIRTAMQLLQDDYLGGQGSRGYGQIEFDQLKVVQKEIDPEKGYSESEELNEIIAKYELEKYFPKLQLTESA